MTPPQASPGPVTRTWAVYSGPDSSRLTSLDLRLLSQWKLHLAEIVLCVMWLINCNPHASAGLGQGVCVGTPGSGERSFQAHLKK